MTPNQQLSLWAALLINSAALINSGCAQTTQQFGPMKCKDSISCGQDDVSLEIAAKSFAPMKEWQELCKRNPTNGNLLSRNHDCSLHTAVDKNACDEAAALTGRHLDYYWGPLEAFVDGKQALASLLEHLKKGDVFPDLESDTPKLIMDAGENSAHERHLSLCDAKIIAGILAPPLNCATVAIIAPTGTWLRGDPDVTTCLASASFRLSGAINIEFEVLTRSDPNKLADALERMMSSDLGLSVERKSYEGEVKLIQLDSASPLQDSKILPKGWRESLDFDISLYAHQAEIRISGVAHALVCRQALGSISEYQGLDDAQRSAYAVGLDSRVADTIKKTCKNYVKQDARRISCD